MEDNIKVMIENITLLHATDKAYLIKNLEGTEVWIPKSQVTYIALGKEIIEKGKPVKEIIEMEIPQWLAEKNDLY